MDNFFLANAMMYLQGMQQTQNECQQLLYPNFSTCISSNRNSSEKTVVLKRHVSEGKNGHFSYHLSDFCPPVFDEWVKIEGMTGEETGYARCNADEKIVEIQVKVTQVCDKEVVLQCVKNNILSALSHGYTQIKASVGVGDKWAKEILGELGFRQNSGENKDA